MSTRAYVLVTTEIGKALPVAEELQILPEVRTADVVTGTYDVVLVVEGRDTKDIGRLVLDKIHRVPGLKGTLTLIALG